uniref:TerB-C domain-containing protein n=1 Tax=Arcella intermedia TaxID=1963864 RepID=A0A6B2KY13_9EUKA
MLYQWCGRLRSFFLEEIFNLQPDHNCDISKLHSRDIFNPVVPLFEVPSKKDEGRMKLKTARSEKPGTLTSSEHQRPGVLDFSNFFSFIEEHKKSIKEKLSDLSIFPSNDKLVTFSEAKLVTLVYHLRDIAQHFSDGVEYIEKMLFDQIVQAIGKEVTPVDFTNYMRYHNRVLFKAEYLPKGFCYPIKRPDHYPEGVLSIESELNDGSLPQSIPTVVRSAPAMRPMKFALNASTEVTFMGHRYLHAWVSHQFSGDTGYNLYMNARAHQFSSFILLIGTMGAVDLFQPKYGIIIQNKDDLKIPLMVETIPTPKQFRDAIESLSPEQQRFAKAYRSMQLSGTLFSICVIQIKPQMEKLLRLPQDSLTKEIQLSQDLMELFIKYQIPSDLLTYDGPENAPVATKITSVQQNVNSIKEVIQKAIQLQIKEQLKQQAYLHPTPILPPPEPEPILEVYEEEERDYREYELDMKMDKMMLFDDAPVQMSLSLDMVSIKEDIAPKREKEVMKKKSAAPAKSRKAMAPSPSPAKPSAAPSSNASSIAVPKSPVAEAKVAPAEAPKAATPAEPPKPATPAEPPKPATPETTQPQEKAKELLPATSAIQIATEEEPDYTKIPTSLDDKYGKYDEDNALHATTITASTPWSMSFQANILSPRQTKSLEVADLETAKNAAFDLLDALTCSGAILVEDADFHVLLGVAHQFEKSLMGTLVQDNINPIEKLERSVLLTATTVMGKDVKELVKEEVLERIRMHSPNLLAADEEE